MPKESGLVRSCDVQNMVHVDVSCVDIIIIIVCFGEIYLEVIRLSSIYPRRN